MLQIKRPVRLPLTVWVPSDELAVAPAGENSLAAGVRERRDGRARKHKPLEQGRNEKKKKKRFYTESRHIGQSFSIDYRATFRCRPR